MPRLCAFRELHRTKQDFMETNFRFAEKLEGQRFGKEKDLCVSTLKSLVLCLLLANLEPELDVAYVSGFVSRHDQSADLQDFSFHMNYCSQISRCFDGTSIILIDVLHRWFLS
jgi:hypothetical protein